MCISCASTLNLFDWIFVNEKSVLKGKKEKRKVSQELNISMNHNAGNRGKEFEKKSDWKIKRC